jgi:hypothetical protein
MLYDMEGGVMSDESEERIQRLELQIKIALEVVEERDAEIKRLRECIEGIEEYWNRDENDGAMSDALWTIIDRCGEVLRDSADEESHE